MQVIFDSTLNYELPALKAVVGADVEAFLQPSPSRTLETQEGAVSDDPAVQWRRKEPLGSRSKAENLMRLANYLSWATPWETSSYTLLPTSIACAPWRSFVSAP